MFEPSPHQRPGRRISGLIAPVLVGLAGVLGCGADAAPPHLGFGDGVSGPVLDTVGAGDTGAGDTGSTVDGAPDTAPSPDVAGADTSAPDGAVPDTSPDTGPTDAVSTDLADAGPPVDPTVAGPMPFTEESVTVAGFASVLFMPTASVTVPAVVLAPGFLLDGSSYHGYARHLATHGLAVLVPTFGDGITRPIDHSVLADGIVAMIDTLAADPRVDPARLGAGGHSRGGKVSILAATRDARIRASFNLDPVDSVGPRGQPTSENPSVAPELMGDLTIALGLIGTTRGAIPVFPGLPECAPVVDNYEAYADAATSADLFVAVPPLSGHNDFPDPLPATLRLACPAGDDPGAVRIAGRTWMTAFYRVHLAGDARYAPWLTPP